MPLRTELIRAGSIGLTVRLMALLAGLMSSIVLARIMGPSEYGVYTYVFVVMSVLALPAQMGVPTLVVRETARAAAEQDWPRMRGLWKWALLVTLGGSSIIIGISLVGLKYFGATESDGRLLAFSWALPLVPLLGLSAVAGAALMGLKRIFLGQFPDQILRPLLLAISFFVVATIQPRFANASIGLIFLCVTLTFTLALTFHLLVKSQPEALKLCRQTQIKHRKWRGAIIPLSFLTGLQLISQNTDLLMLGLFRPNEDVGLYKIAISISTLTILGITTFNVVMQPFLAELLEKRDKAKLQLIASAGATAAITFTLPVVAIFVIVGRDLISLLYGDAFSGASPALVLLSLGAISTAFCGVAGVLLTMASLERMVVRLLIASTLSNVILNALLIPKFGTVGAATATAISGLMMNVLLWRAAKGLLDVDCSPVKALSTVRHTILAKFGFD